ncbi:MAG: hypothetical protein ACTSWC_10825 [Promethearchaeota archaeon]
MDLTMVQFNTLFKQKMQEAKIIEKTHPRDAEKLWFQLTLFMINFAKSSNCPRKLRKQLIFQADTIVKKIKLIRAGVIKSVVDSNFSREELDQLVASLNSTPAQVTHTTSNSEIFHQDSEADLIHPQINEDESVIFSQLQAFPDVPKELMNAHPNDLSAGNTTENTTRNIIGSAMGNTMENATENLTGNITGNIPGNTAANTHNNFTKEPSEIKPTNVQNPFFLPPSYNPKTKLFNGTNKGIEKADLAKLSTLEEELKKMPDIMKEVSPTPFSNASIITPGAVPSNTPILNQFKQPPTTLDITKTEVEDNASEIEPARNLSTASSSKNYCRTQKAPKIAGFQNINLKNSEENVKNVVDPFGPQGLVSDPHFSQSDFDSRQHFDKKDENNLDSSMEQFCFACGGKLTRGNSICPHCGTENL